MGKFFQSMAINGCVYEEIQPRFPFNYEGTHKAFIVQHPLRPNQMYICLNEDGTILDQVIEEQG